MNRATDDKLRVFSGTANPKLAREIADELGISLGKADVGRFKNGEVRVIINESVRGTDVFVVQPTCGAVNDSILELLIMIDALRRASAQRITAVIPHFAYARQDRKTRGREPISAKLIANLITTAGADRVVTMDLHAGQIQGFFDIPVDHLSAVPLLADYFKSLEIPDLVVVSPDIGGVARAREMANRLGVGLAIIDKRRPEPGVAELVHVIGDVAGKSVILIDDIIDTGGTIAQAAEVLKEHGARAVLACCTHPVLSPPAMELLAKAPLDELVVTNTIPLQERALGKIRVLSVAPLLAEAIIRVHRDLSVSALFQ